MIYRLCLLSMLLTALAAAQTYDDWVQHRDSLKSDPGVVGFWTFEDMSGENPVSANLRGAGHELRYVLVPKQGAPDQPLTMVPGRFAGKQAVRLDLGRLEGEPFPVTGKAFSVSCWVRKLGPGTHRGNNESTNGTIVSTGVGYWDGWRVCTWYPQDRVTFEIGRPQPSSAVNIGGEPVLDGPWQHLCATWDGKKMRLYVNGLVLAEGDYAGEYTEPPNDKKMRVGFAGSGVGSAVLEVDEVVLYNRALWPGEVLKEAYLEPTLAEETGEGLGLAEVSYQAKDYAKAAQGYGEMLKARLSPGLQSLVRLRLAQTEWALHRPTQALEHAVALMQMQGGLEANKVAAQGLLLKLAREGAGTLIPAELYRTMLALPNLAPTDKMNAHLQLAAHLRRAGKAQEAEAEQQAALQIEGLTMLQKVNTLLALGHMAKAGKDYVVAAELYKQAGTTPGAPIIAWVSSRFGLAECAASTRNSAEAQAALQAVIDRAEVPEHLRQEARERLAELKGEKRPSSRMVLPAAVKPAVTFYVAPDGKDTNAGTLEAPFATLKRARDAVRAARVDGRLPAGGAKVYLRGGVYRATETFELTAEDGGTAEAPVVWRNYREEKPVFSGVKRLSGMKPCTDEAVLARLPQESRGKVLEIDLKANGVTDYGEVRAHGYAMGAAPQTEVFWNGKPLRLARWPNEGWMRIGEVVSGGAAGEKPTVFTAAGETPALPRFARWAQARDVMLDGYWQWDWAEAIVGPVTVDAEKGQITIPEPPGYGVRAGQRWFALNLLEEIDQPGEYYLDRESGKLYIHAPPEAAKLVEIGTLGSPFVSLTDCAYVTLQGFTFDGGRGNGIEIRGGNDCALSGCTIRRVAMDGVVVDGGKHNGLFGCDIEMTGRGGVVMAGGDRKTLEPGEHLIENCHIHDFSRIDRSYTPAVLMNGVGNRVVHNLIHESPHHALRIEGNDHYIAYNEVHSVVLEGDDQGGVDMWGNATYRGNQYVYNYWHHIGSGVACGQAGIRLDDAISGTLIYGNVFEKCSEANFGAIQIHGGKENIVDNNMFVECKFGISFSGWGQVGWGRFLDSHEAQLHRDVDITQPPYATKYPDLAKIREGEGVNMVWRNVAVRCGEFMTRDRGIQEAVDNTVTAEGPNGYGRIPFKEIGLYQEGRASWPVVNEVSPNYRPEKRGE